MLHWRCAFLNMLQTCLQVLIRLRPVSACHSTSRIRPQDYHPPGFLALCHLPTLLVCMNLTKQLHYQRRPLIPTEITTVIARNQHLNSIAKTQQ